jgi:hypothetical protein
MSDSDLERANGLTAGASSVQEGQDRQLADKNVRQALLTDCSLAKEADRAVADGSQILSWCSLSDGERGITPFALDLRTKFRLQNRAEGYFGKLRLNGADTPVMGCRQDVLFGRGPDVGAVDAVREFVVHEFLRRAHWTHSDGSPGGFAIQQTVYKTVAGSCGLFPVGQQSDCVSWDQIGPQYTWVLLTVQLNDFALQLGPLRKRVRAAVCVALCPTFFQVRHEPSAELKVKISVGYPFLQYAPIPSIFGFGPGKFGTAIKTYSFSVDRGDNIRVEMEFAAAPRSERVLDLGYGLPDPVYGAARVLEAASFGRWRAEAFHDICDTAMLALHCRVHQALIDGTEMVWRRWLVEHVQ